MKGYNYVWYMNNSSLDNFFVFFFQKNYLLHPFNENNAGIALF